MALGETSSLHAQLNFASYTDRMRSAVCRLYDL